MKNAILIWYFKELINIIWWILSYLFRNKVTDSEQCDFI